LHRTVAIFHLKYASGQLADDDPSPKTINMGLPVTASSGLTALGNEMALRSARCLTTSRNSLLVPSGTGSSHATTRPVDSSNFKFNILFPIFYILSTIKYAFIIIYLQA